MYVLLYYCIIILYYVILYYIILEYILLLVSPFVLQLPEVRIVAGELSEKEEYVCIGERPFADPPPPAHSAPPPAHAPTLCFGSPPPERPKLIKPKGIQHFEPRVVP